MAAQLTVLHQVWRSGSAHHPSKFRLYVDSAHPDRTGQASQQKSVFACA